MTNSDIPLKTDVISLNDRQLTLEVPADPDQILSDAIDSTGEPNTNPYWGILWPAAIRTADRIIRHNWQRSGIQVLEVGCGVGLAGIAALTCGHHVVFTDVVADAVELAVQNAHRNGLTAAEGLVLDWKNPIDRKFDLIIGSDVLYESDSHDKMLTLFDTMLTQQGEVWLGDMGRGNAVQFATTIPGKHWDVRITDEHGHTLNHAVHQQYQLFQLSRKLPFQSQIVP